jgi:creatinine amidohydrolase
VTRQYGALAAPDVPSLMTRDSVLCLPIGSYEQHGPHLPLQTDTIIAEGFTSRLVDRYGSSHDLWQLPAIPYGLSLEHAWAPGTISLLTAQFSALLDAIVGQYVHATPARKLLIVNGHGGNRGILEVAIYELTRAHQVSVCVVHPSSMSTVKIDSELPEIHAGTRETSVIMALAPEQVHLERLTDAYRTDPGQREQIRRLVLDRGVTWPWTSADERISSQGITGGDARAASAGLGEAIITSALDASAAVLDAL